MSWQILALKEYAKQDSSKLSVEKPKEKSSPLIPTSTTSSVSSPPPSVKIIESGLCFFLFLSHFYFLFDLFFTFSIFRTLGLGLEVIGHISHI